MKGRHSKQKHGFLDAEARHCRHMDAGIVTCNCFLVLGSSDCFAQAWVSESPAPQSLDLVKIVRSVSGSARAPQEQTGSCSPLGIYLHSCIPPPSPARKRNAAAVHFRDYYRDI